MRHSAHTLALAGLVWAALAAPAAVSALEGGAPAVRLMAPRAGATLAAGSTAELEWAPLTAFAKLENVEEWEAFLSLDGGATYPVRITPHLDQDLRRVRWQVPAIPTADARLLLRFGDEREEETSIVLPQRFSIVSSPAAAEAGFTLARVAPARGEPALPGHAGVVAWVEGSRRGGEMRQVVAAERPDVRARLSLPETHAEAAVLAAGQAPLPIPRLIRGGSAQAPPANRGSPLAEPGEVPPHASDILLLIQRQNE
jgi:hypothetical protein